MDHLIPGALLPEDAGKELTIKVTIGYPGSRTSDILIGDQVVKIPNDILRAAIVDKARVRIGTNWQAHEAPAYPKGTIVAYHCDLYRARQDIPAFTVTNAPPYSGLWDKIS